MTQSIGEQLLEANKPSDPIEQLKNLRQMLSTAEVRMPVPNKCMDGYRVSSSRIEADYCNND